MIYGDVDSGWIIRDGSVLYEFFFRPLFIVRSLLLLIAIVSKLHIFQRPFQICNFY